MSTMGQGYRAIILGSPEEKEIIRTFVDSHTYNNGYKLMEHSYVGNTYVEAVEYLICPLAMFYKSRLVWAGDYADKEKAYGQNLYDLSCGDGSERKMSVPERFDMSSYKYIVNHTTKQYVDKYAKGTLHPLPLLTAEGTGRGGGDYREDPLVGTWARHVVSMEKEIPHGYDVLVCDFD